MAINTICRAGQVVIIITILTQSGFSQNEVKNGVAGVVNNEAITLQDIQRQTYMEEQDLRNQQVSGKITKEEMIKKIRDRWSTVLESLIEKKLIIQDYKKKGYNFPDYYFDKAEKQTIRDQYGGDRQALNKTLEERGQTLADWKKDTRETFIVQQMRIINAKRYITISPHMVEEYYQNHVRDFLQPDRVKLRMIYLAPESSPDVEATAKEVLSQVESGSDFSQLARKYSDHNRAGGGLFQENNGWVERDGLRSELAEAAFQLRPGQTSGIISLSTTQGANAFYILQVEEVKKATVTPLSSIRDAIESTLVAAESEKVQKDWIDRLKRDAYIEKFL
jgi:peptidyl-prolyl cis-trans isomerase SurA